jgi:uncharacterized membrane protein YgdD (TMEM256/DUF423 family)
MKTFLSISAIFGFLAVALGAFGAHALREKLSPQMLDVFKTGVQYHFYHTFAILAVALLLKWLPESNLLTYAGYFFIVGIILFSGSLYAYTLTETKTFAMITPVGGLCFLIGWALLFLQALKMQ